MEESENELTTLTLTKATKKSLDDLKIHPRQSYEEIIKKIIGELNPVDPEEAGDISNTQNEGVEKDFNSTYEKEEMQ